MARKKPTGPIPPYEWTAEVEAEIFERVARGEAIRNICGVGRDDWLPSWATFRKRVIADDEFATRYARAKDAKADAIFDEVLTIADQSTPETVAVDRLRIDARKWMAGKLRPKVYGDKQEIDHTSSDGSMGPTRIIIEAAIDDSDDTAAAETGEALQ